MGVIFNAKFHGHANFADNKADYGQKTVWSINKGLSYPIHDKFAHLDPKSDSM